MIAKALPKPRKQGRPPLPAGVAKVRRTLTIDQGTLAAVERLADADRTSWSDMAGQLIRMGLRHVE